MRKRVRDQFAAAQSRLPRLTGAGAVSWTPSRLRTCAWCEKKYQGPLAVKSNRVQEDPTVRTCSPGCQMKLRQSVLFNMKARRNQEREPRHAWTVNHWLYIMGKVPGERKPPA